jgi:soluble lytic murein transglycosylase-like protein
MSALMIAPTAGASEGGPADALGANQRVQQLQTLIAQASSGSTASFATALEAASAGAGAEGGSTLPSTEAGVAAGATAGESSAAPSAGATALAAAGLSPAGTEAGASAPYTTSAAYTTPGVNTTAGPSAYAPLPVAGPSVSAGEPGAESSSSSSVYDAAVTQAAERYGIEPALLHGLIQQESGFDPNARSSSGALGLTQLMPGTASSLGVSDPLDPVQSIEGGARYLSEMLNRFGGNTADALAAYNAGPGAVSQYGGVPPYAETQAYVSKVLGYAAAYRQSLPAAAPVALPLAVSAASPAASAVSPVGASIAPSPAAAPRSLS